jgi:hypothetical protein
MATAAFNQTSVELKGATATLQKTVSDFREACKNLAAMNGHGEPIRRKIRNSLIGIKGKANGQSR